jgi:hypothetical protein
MVADRGGSTYVLPYQRIASRTCRAHGASAPSPCSLYGDASDTVECRPHICPGMDDALCGGPPRHRRAAGVLHEGHRLASSDERTPARRPLWGSELSRVFAGKVITASGLQRSPRRGFDEGEGAMGETRDHLSRLLRFGSHHHAFDIHDHGLRGGPRIEGGACPAGHCLPPAALDPTRPRSTHGVQLLPHDGVLTSEL